MLWQFLCVFLRSVYDRFTIDLRSICVKASDGFHVVSTKKKVSVPCIYTWCLYGASLMEYPCRFHGELMYVSCRFRCFLCPKRDGCMAPSNWCSFHGGSMQVPWRIDVEFMQFPCALWRWCLYLHLLVLPCTLPDAGSMEVPCRFHAGSRELSWRLHTSKLNQQTQHVTNMKPAWKLHGNSMETPWNLHQSEYCTG